jgi:hypothetical protein
LYTSKAAPMICSVNCLCGNDPSSASQVFLYLCESVFICGEKKMSLDRQAYFSSTSVSIAECCMREGRIRRNTWNP